MARRPIIDSSSGFAFSGEANVECYGRSRTMIWYWVIACALVLVSTLLHIAGVVRFDTSIHWTGWLVVALVLLNGGWMAFDGEGLSL